MASWAAHIVGIALHHERLLPLILFHPCKLSAIAIANGSRGGASFRELLHSLQIFLVLFGINQLAILIAHNLALAFHHLRLLCGNLVGARIVSLHDLLLAHDVVHALGILVLVLLADQLLSCLAVCALLVAMMLKVLLVMETFLSNCSEHVVTLANLVESLNILLLLLDAHRLTQLFTVLAGLLDSRNLLLLDLAIVNLGLALDDGTPLVGVSLPVLRIVAIALRSHVLLRSLLVIHGLFDAHGVDFEGVNNLHFYFLFL